MFLKEIKKSLFPNGRTGRSNASAPARGIHGLSEISEPSREISAAVRRRRLGLPDKMVENPGRDWTGPAAYEAYPVHKRATSRGDLATSYALVVTRFRLSSADASMNRFLGRPPGGCGVLDLDLGGLELAWHRDLVRALEDRAAIWSVSRVLQSSGDIVLEHIAAPYRPAAGPLTFLGWFHRIGGSLAGDPNWAEVRSVVRERRSERVSGCLDGPPLTDFAPARSEPGAPGDIVSSLRAKGAM